MPYTTQSRDTNEQAERVQIALLRAAPAWRKLELLNGLNRSLRLFSVVDTRRRTPEASTWHLLERIAGGVLGKDWQRLIGGETASASSEEALVNADIIAVTLLVAEQLERLGVPYALGGSLASSMYGIFRSTNDADLVADLQEEHAEPLARALHGAFYADAAMIRDAISTRGSFNLIHLATMLKVDIFLPGRGAFDGNQLARRVREMVQQEPPRSLAIVSAEDTVLAKLGWYRAGGEISDRQWYDILGVLKVQGAALDLPYLRRWAPELGVTDLLARALDEAGLG